MTVEQQSLFGRTQTRTTCPVCGGSGKEITNKCNTCHGDGVERVTKEVEIKVPEGIETGQQIRLEGYGNKGASGGPNGDLYIVFEVTPSSTYTREGDDLIVEVEISFSQAALGDEIEVPTIYGNVLLKIPSGTQSKTKFRLRGKGAPNVRTKQKGDEHVIVNVQTHTKLNNEQKKLFEQLARLDDSIKSRFRKIKPSFLKR